MPELNLNTANNIPPSLFGFAGFELILNLLTLLAERGVISTDERAKVLKTVAAGLGPADNEHIKSMKSFLEKLSTANYA